MPRKRVLPDYECLGCKKAFRPRLKVDKYCSGSCKYASLSSPEKACLHCNLLFKPAYAEQRFCCHKCGAESQKADRNVTCQCCGIVFQRPHGKKRAFCSNSCSMKARVAGQLPNYANLTVRNISSDGYYTTANGYKARKVQGMQSLQHREVMQKTIGRELHDRERIHHKDGNRANNTPENLELWAMKGVSKKDPAGQRWSDLIESLPLVDGMAASDVRAMLLKFLINK